VNIQVLKMGHPLLFKQCKTVTEFNCVGLDVLAERLLVAREHHQGAGIAAPQIGSDQRVICYGGKTQRYPMANACPPKLLVNPAYQPLGDELNDDWEGCLSVPGLRGLVARFTHVKYTGFDVDGNPVNGQASGFLARVLQHEIDHLNGVLFPQRVKDFSYFGFEEAFAEVC